MGNIQSGKQNRTTTASTMVTAPSTMNSLHTIINTAVSLVNISNIPLPAGYATGPRGAIERIRKNSSYDTGDISNAVCELSVHPLKTSNENTYKSRPISQRFRQAGTSR